jgi:hypothetical protein
MEVEDLSPSIPDVKENLIDHRLGMRLLEPCDLLSGIHQVLATADPDGNALQSTLDAPSKNGRVPDGRHAAPPWRCRPMPLAQVVFASDGGIGHGRALME